MGKAYMKLEIKEIKAYGGKVIKEQMAPLKNFWKHCPSNLNGDAKGN